MADYAVSTLSEHLDVGDASLNELYPFLIENGTDSPKYEIPRIIYRLFLKDRLEGGEVYKFNAIDWTSYNLDDLKVAIAAMSEDDIACGITYVSSGSYKTFKTPIKTAVKRLGYVPNEMVNKVLETQISKEDTESGKYMLFFEKPETESVLIFNSYNDYYHWNLAASLASRVLPWFFTDKPLSEDERELAVSIGKSTDRFIAAAKKLYARSGVAELVNGIKFRKMFQMSKQKLIADAQNRIDGAIQTFDNLRRQFEQQQEIYRSATIQKEALENATDEDDHGLADYFTKKPNVEIKGWNGNKLTFTTGTRLEVSHESDLDYIERNDSQFYRYKPGNVDIEDAKKLMRAAFVDHDISIPVFTNVTFDLEHSSMSRAEDREPAPKFADYEPQPHHYGYNCFGNNLARAEEFIREGKYTLAIDQIIGCVADWNYQDGTVTDKVGREYLWNIDKTTYRLPDGKKVNYVDAIAYLKQEEETNDGETVEGN